MDNQNGLVQNQTLDFDQQDYANSQNFLIDLMKQSLIFGADKVLMSRKLSVTSASLNGLPREVGEEKNTEAETKKGLFQSYDHDVEYVDVSKAVDYSSGGFNDFPLNIVSFFAILLLKSIAFQFSLFTSFFTVPIWLSYNTFMFFVFPFQTLIRIRQHLMKTLFRMWFRLYLSITSSIINQLTPQKSLLGLASKLGRAVFWSIYVCFVLFGLLVSGFVIGSLAMRRVVEKPVHTKETLNFDYTKASPVAFVPVMSSSGGLVSKDGAATFDGDRAIPYDHKLQLTVSLTLPESDYNRNLGVFQVKVEFLSANGKVTASSSYPSILKFKSKHVRFVETVLKTAPLIAGFQSESQTLEIKFRDFTEGIEPTACLKVVLEQRAEYQSGAGIPQIYAASLALESELPRIKNLVWYWRRTIFVWISLVSFFTELVVVLIFFRPLIAPRGRTKAVEAKVDSGSNRIYWKKNV